MLMILGPYPFILQTLPYQGLRRSAEYRHPTQSRVGARPRTQYLGPGADLIELTGILMPELTGGQLTLDALRLLALAGKAWPLIEGTGRILGLFVIEQVEESGSMFLANGASARIEFTLRLRRVDDWADLIAGASGAAAAITGAL